MKKLPKLKNLKHLEILGKKPKYWYKGVTDTPIIAESVINGLARLETITVYENSVKKTYTADEYKSKISGT